MDYKQEFIELFKLYTTQYTCGTDCDIDAYRMTDACINCPQYQSKTFKIPETIYDEHYLGLLCVLQYWYYSKFEKPYSIYLGTKVFSDSNYTSLKTQILKDIVFLYKGLQFDDEKAYMYDEIRGVFECN